MRINFSSMHKPAADPASFWEKHAQALRMKAGRKQAYSRYPLFANRIDTSFPRSLAKNATVSAVEPVGKVARRIRVRCKMDVSEGSTYRWHPRETVSADTGTVFFQRFSKNFQRSHYTSAQSNSWTEPMNNLTLSWV